MLFLYNVYLSTFQWKQLLIFPFFSIPQHHFFRSYQGFTCLMQISTRKEDYIVDTLLLRDELHLLNEVFTDPKILKVNYNK